MPVVVLALLFVFSVSVTVFAQTTDTTGDREQIRLQDQSGDQLRTRERLRDQSREQCALSGETRQQNQTRTRERAGSGSPDGNGRQGK